MKSSRFVGSVSLALAATLGSAWGQPPTLDPTFGLKTHLKKAPALKPDAVWIWTAKTTRGQVVQFRKRFNFPKLGQHPTIYVTADDRFDLWLNGQQVNPEPPSNDEYAWRTVHAYDLSKFLHEGENEIAVRAQNTDGPAGLLARLEIDGKLVLVSDSTWRCQESTQPANLDFVKSNFPDATWSQSTAEFPVGQGPWADQIEGWPVAIAQDVSYLAHLTIQPTRVADAPDVDHMTWSDVSKSGTYVRPKAAKPGATWRIVFDFGKELTGRVMAMQEGVSAPLVIGTGESEGEAIEKPFKTDKSSKAAITGPYSAFRFVSVEVPYAVESFRFRPVVDHLYYPVQYRGSFDCSDSLLTQIWYTGAYTAHLCMQQDIWDAPKRDRLKWMGDLHVSGEVINNVFLDRFLMEQTMDRLRAEAQGGNPPLAQPAQNVNGIPGYSCAWICGMADFFRHVGDRQHLLKQHDALVSLLAYLKGELDESGHFANRHGNWPFVDWSPDFNHDSPQARATTHLFLVKATQEAEFLFHQMGDEANAHSTRAWGDDLTRVAQAHLVNEVGTYSSRLQENAMAVISKVATPIQRHAIAESIFRPDSAAWSQVVSPYYGNYVLSAMGDCGQTPLALDWIRRNWGGMIAEGATSFYEGYDPSWDKHNFHAHLQADDGTGYFVSLCHGWSTGPTNFLTERVLGVKSTGAGFETCSIEPVLAGLSWAAGVVPTPRGGISVRIERSGDNYRLQVSIPRLTKASVKVPGRLISVDGKPAGGTAITLEAGKHHLESVAVSTPQKRL